MITVISGTNRPHSNTAKIAQLAAGNLRGLGETVEILDLTKLPAELFDGASYREKPAAFAPFQASILEADGILTVVPEYNGACPGVLKYFIDMLRFPESLYEKPAAFVGLSAGPWGAIRAVEQIEMVFQYRHAHLFGRRIFIPNVGKVVNDEGRITDELLAKRLAEMLEKFASFCSRLKP
jgi:NAD(P)H-dependent FMN reductase